MMTPIPQKGNPVLVNQTPFLSWKRREKLGGTVLKFGGVSASTSEMESTVHVESLTQLGDTVGKNELFGSADH